MTFYYFLCFMTYVSILLFISFDFPKRAKKFEVKTKGRERVGHKCVKIGN